MLKRYLCFFCVTCIYSHSGDISARAPFKFCAVITIYSYSPNSSLLIRRLKLNCQVHVQFPRFNACVTAKQQLATAVCSLTFQAYVVIFGTSDKPTDGYQQSPMWLIQHIRSCWAYDWVLQSSMQKMWFTVRQALSTIAFCLNSRSTFPWKKDNRNAWFPRTD